MCVILKICLSLIVLTSALTMEHTLNGDTADENLLDNYLPACMQALAYYIDLLQYEPISSTTIEPPFFAENGLDEKRTTSMPFITQKSTTKKVESSWFQSPSWWSTSSGYETTTTVKPIPTHIHKPGLYAPYTADLLYANYVTTNVNREETESSNEQQTSVKFPFDSDASFKQWLKNQKPVFGKDVDEGKSHVLNRLPSLLLHVLGREIDNQHQKPELQNLDNFLRNYDDTYGRNSPRTSSGKKRIPPTKAYVEFLLIYDLLKRDAKAGNLSKYEGYSNKIIDELYELSKASPQRQLYTLFKRMLERKEIERSDIVSRAQKLVKELGDGKSVISMSIMYFSPMQFLP